MSPTGWDRLDLVADLRLEVDGSPVTVTADGTEVLIALDAPDRVFDAVVGLPLPIGLDRRGARRGLARFAETVADQGLDVVVTGPSGVLVTAGVHSSPSRLVRWATGTDRLDLGPWAAVRLPLAMTLRSRLVRLVAAVRGRIRR